MGRYHQTAEERDATLRAAGRRLAKEALLKAVQKKRKEDDAWTKKQNIVIAVVIAMVAVAAGVILVYDYHYPGGVSVSPTQEVCTEIASSKNWETILQSDKFSVAVPAEKMCKALRIPDETCEKAPTDIKVVPWVVEKYVERYPKACWESILIYMCMLVKTERQVGLNIARRFGVPRYARYC